MKITRKKLKMLIEKSIKEMYIVDPKGNAMKSSGAYVQGISKARDFLNKARPGREIGTSFFGPDHESSFDETRAKELQGMSLASNLPGNDLTDLEITGVEMPFDSHKILGDLKPVSQGMTSGNIEGWMIIDYVTNEGEKYGDKWTTSKEAKIEIDQGLVTELYLKLRKIENMKAKDFTNRTWFDFNKTTSKILQNTYDKISELPDSHSSYKQDAENYRNNIDTEDKNKFFIMDKADIFYRADDILHTHL